MLTPTREILGFRTLAVVVIVLFMPALVSFAVAPGIVAIEYTGILFHLAILFLISRMDAPGWGKAAGYGWIVLDVLSGVLTINGVPMDIAWPVRLAGHILAGTWIVTTSVLSRSRSVAALGIVTGLWLGLYTFVATVLPTAFLYPSGLLLIGWLALLAVKYEPSEEHEVPTSNLTTADARHSNPPGDKLRPRPTVTPGGNGRARGK